MIIKSAPWVEIDVNSICVKQSILTTNPERATSTLQLQCLYLTDKKGAKALQRKLKTADPAKILQHLATTNQLKPIP